MQRAGAHIAFTAHSLPIAMAEASDYVAQLGETARLVAERGAPGHPWALVYQSRSGPPSQPWLTPDIGDHIDALVAANVPAVVVVPIGFVSDHMEVDQRPRLLSPRTGPKQRASSSSDASTPGYRSRVRVDGARARRGATRSVATEASAWFAGRAAGRVPGLLRVSATERRRALRGTASSPSPRRSRSRSAADGRRSSRRHARSRAPNDSGSRMSIGAIDVAGVRST